MELSQLEQPERKPYEMPAVVYEARLEVRAGSTPNVIPGSPPNPTDLFPSK